jgi:hypothetical protein
MPRRHTRRKTRRVKRTRKGGRHHLRKTVRGGYNPVVDNDVYPGVTKGYPISTNWALPDPGHYETGINQINGPSSGGRRR